MNVDSLNSRAKARRRRESESERERGRRWWSACVQGKRVEVRVGSGTRAMDSINGAMETGGMSDLTVMEGDVDGTRMAVAYTRDGEEVMVSAAAAGGRAQPLSRMESTVAYAVLDLLLERLKLLGVVTVDATTQAQELSRSVGEEISRVMEEQKVLEERFEALIQARTALKDMPNKSKFKENQDQLNHVASKLRQTTLTLRRNLKDNPNISDNVAKIHKERLSLQMLLVEILSEIEDGCYESLSTRLSSIAVREQVIRDTMTREREATSAVRSLRKQITGEKEEHLSNMSDKKKLVQTIKEELKQTKSRTKTELKVREAGTNVMMCVCALHMSTDSKSVCASACVRNVCLGRAYLKTAIHARTCAHSLSWCVYHTQFTLYVPRALSPYHSVFSSSSFSTPQTQYRIDEVTAQNECQRRMYETGLGALTDRIAQLEKQLETEKSVHVANVSFLEKHVTSLQEQVLKWDERMTSDSLSKDRDLESLKEYHARDRERLKAMQMEYQKALNEKEKREYESKRADDARYSDGGKLEILQRSAKIIQLAWRRHVERKEKDSHKGGGGKKKSSKH